MSLSPEPGERGRCVVLVGGARWPGNCVRRTVVLPVELAGRRGLSASGLLAEYAEQGLQAG